VLARLRKASDSDRDGASGLFGGGDCDDHNPEIGPHADDVPGNGKDEDCSGKDAEKVELGARSEQAPKDARKWALEKLPPKPNLILITVDTLRHDLGFKGYERRSRPTSTVARSGCSRLPLASIRARACADDDRQVRHRNASRLVTLIASVRGHVHQERLQKRCAHTECPGLLVLLPRGYGYERGFDLIDSAAPKVIQMEAIARSPPTS
jgi:hypothetical protein